MHVWERRHIEYFEWRRLELVTSSTFCRISSNTHIQNNQHLGQNVEKYVGTFRRLHGVMVSADISISHTYMLLVKNKTLANKQIQRRRGAPTTFSDVFVEFHEQKNQCYAVVCAYIGLCRLIHAMYMAHVNAACPLHASYTIFFLYGTFFYI